VSHSISLPAVALAAGIACSGASAQVTKPEAGIAPPARLLIGTYTANGSEGIYLYDFDTETGRIDARPRQVVKAENPSWLTFSTDRQVVYVVNESAPTGRVTAYRIDPGDGRLQEINSVLSLGAEPTHSGISADGKYLFVANYSVSPDPGGTLSVLPLGERGALAPATQVKTDRASQVDHDRQMSPHVHSAVVAPGGRAVFAQDLGADRIYVYRYDPANAEAPLTRDEAQPSVETPPGSGPRHLVFSRDGHHAYLTLEMIGEVAVYDYAAGKLTQKQRVSLAPSGFSGRNGAAALHLSSDGRFLYVTNRGTDNQLVTFAVHPVSGELSMIARRSTEGLEPREFAIDPSGRYVLVANQHSDKVMVMKRDPATGRIGETIQILSIATPSDLKFE
jgi:6-phosphogluconolactonase (cycloisomerase 2 family)